MIDAQSEKKDERLTYQNVLVERAASFITLRGKADLRASGSDFDNSGVRRFCLEGAEAFLFMQSFETLPKSCIEKHSIGVGKHKTSISLEPEFWQAFNSIAKHKKLKLLELLDQIDRRRDLEQNLSSAVRVYVLEYFIKRCGTD